jgi:hypothetical protein
MKRRDVRFSTYLALSTLGAALTVFALAGCGGNSGPVPGAVGTSSGGNVQVGGTGSTVNLTGLLPDGQAGATRVGKDTCGGCHGPAKATEGDVDKLTTFNETQHAKSGIECEDCHGPGSNHVNADPADRQNTILTFPNIMKPVVCAQCHSAVTRQAGEPLDQYDEWTASKHDGVVADAANSTGRYATCMRCHTDWMRIQELEEGQPLTEEELTEITETALEAEEGTGPFHSASCAVCHDPHGKHSENALHNGEDKQLRHKPHQVLTQANYATSAIGPGTQPTSYAAFDHVCAECHNARGVDPSDARLQASTSRPSMHDSNQFNMLMGFGGSEADLAVPNDKRASAHRDVADQCVGCHMSQGHAMVAGNQGCTGTGGCHSASEVASLKSALQNSVSDGVAALQLRMNRWGSTPGNDIDGKGSLSWQYSGSFGGPASGAAGQGLVPIQVKRARHNYYFILRDLSKGVHNPVYTRYLLQQANAQLDQLGVARAKAAEVARARFELGDDLESASHSTDREE